MIERRNSRLVALLLAAISWQSAAFAQIDSDVIYGHKDGMALVYDVFHAAEPNGAGVVYMVSGGWFSRWQEPEKRLQQFAPLLNEGFTVFAVYHGSAPRFKVPDAVSDVRAAVRHIRTHAGDYGVAADRLGVWGGSAGGHLSLMLGLDAESVPMSAEGEGRARFLAPSYAVSSDADGRLAAVVAFYPPVDLRPRVGPSERFPALNFSPDAAAAISPILFVSKDDPPTMLIHGDADTLVPLADSEILAQELAATGVEHDLLVIAGGGHGFRNPSHRAEATRAMVAWFKAHLL
ncbi:MAG: alpha/beta hydrolase [Gammaproteobacteria bacterium]|nr:alpha/beta hydrolase [Gammaproteobacteria bacterium]